MADGGEVRWCVVTGGRGFAARHLVEMLLRSQQWRVRVADLAPSIKLDPREEEESGGVLGTALRSGGALYVSTDLRDKAQVLQAFQGAEVVFHMAAPDSSINNHQLHYSVNVEGTKNVIDACIECKVKRLIYTSSPSVVFDGIHPLHNVDESMPYPQKFNDSYSETKAEAEKLVIKANGRDGLLTCCIRPSSIFGPGDKLMVPSLVAAARAGKSKFIIGDGNNMYDFTYVENVAHGHICAEKALAAGGNGTKVAGQAYFITNMEPIKFWEFMSRILEGLGYERDIRLLPATVVFPLKCRPSGFRPKQEKPSTMCNYLNDLTFIQTPASRYSGSIRAQPLYAVRRGVRVRETRDLVRETSATLLIVVGQSDKVQSVVQGFHRARGHGVCIVQDSSRRQ
ncbi:hypothetical protein Taro_029137 [Colocasia esculenta]|uniref:3-beta hydroxysteroid dehydrogenase/isomerase domain-containing protein n=1 Tax=Colocasia esculenta TaxID=4460 RepID=A0A843VU01_COLES|nr:hypothetical protein [Colocasia esculenta]